MSDYLQMVERKLAAVPPSGIASKRGARVQLTCGACSGAFVRLLCQLGRGRGAYCSKACTASARRSGGVLQCEWCDTSFYRSLSEQDVGTKARQFCSAGCYAEWRADKRMDSTYPKDGGRHAHRVVAERLLGRPLVDGEVVHHIDADKGNVAPENLAVFPSQSHHMRCHMGSMTAEELNGYRLTLLAGGAQ